MRKNRGLSYLLACTLVVAGRGSALGLDITLDSGAGSLNIADNDGNDANTDVGVIDFDLSAAPVGGIFSASGRVLEANGAINHLLSLTSTPPATHGVLQNVGGGAATFTVTVNSSAFTTSGSPLGWYLSYNGSADDPTPDDVEVTSHVVDLYADTSELLSTLTAAAISPPVAPASQPAIIDEFVSASAPTGDASSMRLVFTFSAGAGDRILLPDDNEFQGVGIEAVVFDNNDKCIDKVTAASRDLTRRVTTNDLICIRKQMHLGGGDVTACVDSPSDASTDSIENRTLDFIASRCLPGPAWGANAASCCEDSSNDGASCSTDPECPGGACLPGACMTAAAESSASQLTHDLFSATVVAEVHPNFLCQRDLLNGARKVIDTRLAEYRRCKRTGLSTITDDLSLVATCLAPQPDPQGRIPRAQNYLEARVDACVFRGTTPVGSVATGVCGGENDDDIGACIGRRVACRFCLMVNQTDDIVPPVDCDLFDDGTANTSCP